MFKRWLMRKTTIFALTLLLVAGCCKPTGQEWHTVANGSTPLSSPEMRQKYYNDRYACDGYAGILFEHCMNAKGWER